MRIACSSCNAVYEVPPERVKPGRGVKCARCGTVWVPVELVDGAPEIQPTAPPDPVPPEPEPVPEPVPEAPAADPVPPPPVPEPPAPPKRSRVPVLLGWLLTLVLLAGLGWAAVTYRAAVIAAWPPAERAYRLLPLKGNSLAP